MQRPLGKGQLPEAPVSRILVELLPALVRLAPRDQTARDEPEDAPIDLVQPPTIVILGPCPDQPAFVGTELRKSGHPCERAGAYWARWLEGGTRPLMRR